jgi:hypothetical protein
MTTAFAGCGSEGDAAQRDRSLPLHWFDQFDGGSMVAYDRLFPADWDLLVAHENRSYWL